MSGKFAIAVALLLVALPVAALSREELPNFFQSGGGWLPEKQPTHLFPDHVCQTNPITYHESLPTARGVKYLDWSVDVTAVAEDMDPNTYILCSSDENASLGCVVGFPDGTTVGCRERSIESGNHRKVSQGDIVILRFDAENAESCRIKIVDQGALFRDADPKCRKETTEQVSTSKSVDLGY